MAASRLCVIPARGGSKRLPRKNLLPVGGIPLVARAVVTALASGLFDAVYVSTDDAEIAEVARQYGGSVPFLRDAGLATGVSSVEDVALDMADRLRAEGTPHEKLCFLMPTAPLRTSDDIARSWELFESSKAGFLMSVAAYLQGSPYWALREGPGGGLSAVFGAEHFTDAHSHAVGRILSPSGVVRWVDIEALRRERTFYGRGLVGYEVPAYRAVEVDHPDDLLIIDAILNHEVLGREARTVVAPVPCA